MEYLKKSVVSSVGQFSCPLPIGSHLVELLGYGVKLKKTSSTIKDYATKIEYISKRVGVSPNDLIFDMETVDKLIEVAAIESVTPFQLFWQFGVFAESSITEPFYSPLPKGMNKPGIFELNVISTTFPSTDAKGVIVEREALKFELASILPVKDIDASEDETNDVNNATVLQEEEVETSI